MDRLCNSNKILMSNIYIFHICYLCVSNTTDDKKKKWVSGQQQQKKMLNLLFDIIIPVEDFHGFTFKTKKSKAVPAGAHKSSG